MSFVARHNLGGTISTVRRSKSVKSNRISKTKPGVEFSAYGSLQDKVRDLVDRDNGAKIFFENLNKITFSHIILYKAYIHEVFEDLFLPNGSGGEYSSSKLGIFPTTVQIQIREDGKPQSHSIVLIWNGYTLYLYDPNGAYNTQEPGVQGMIQEYGYSCFGKYFNSTLEFQTYIQTIFNITFTVPTNIGAQYLLRIATESSYISEGGYCMFFNYKAIEYILKNYNNTNLQDLYITITTSPFSKVFPKPAANRPALNGTVGPTTFEGQTIQIIEEVFGSGSDENDLDMGSKKSRSKRQRGSEKIKRKPRKTRRK